VGGEFFTIQVVGDNMPIHLKETIWKLTFTITVVKATIIGGNIKLKN
jgi:hypothetical protein